jgi:transcriptional regulator with XRE-family HTH domain
MTLGNRLNQIRKEKGISQQAFAAMLNTSSGYISEIEQGKKMPGSEFLLSLWRVFGVDLNWFLAGEEKGMAAKSEIEYDRELLIQAIKVMEECLARKGFELDPGRKGKVAVKLFENLKKSGVSAENLAIIEGEALDLVELVLSE